MEGGIFHLCIVMKPQKMPGAVYSKSHLHSCFMNVLKKFLTALAEGKCSKELTGRLVLLSKLCHSFLII